MNNETVQKLKDLIANNASIAIAVGKNPNLDEMGAALGFYLVLQAMGKQVTVASPTAPLVEVSSLVGINKVKKAFDGEGGDLVVSFPYREGEIEKVSYTLEDGYLNIIVKAGELGLSFDEKSVDYRRSGGVPSVLFVIGTPRLSDLGNLFNPEALKDTTLINIDNKQDNQGFGDVVLVSQRFSSVSEQVAHLLTSLGYTVDVDAAQNLLSGISSATQNFQKPGTSVVAFEMAALLMKKGALREKASAPRQNAEDSAYFAPAPQQTHGQQQKPQQPFMDQRNQNNAPKPFKNPFPPHQQPRPAMQQQVHTQPQSQQPMQQSHQQPQQAQGGHGQQQPRPNFNQRMDNDNTGEQKEAKSQDAPADWLTPKIYKGSTNI